MAAIMPVPPSGSESQFDKKLQKMPIDIVEDCISLIKIGSVDDGFIAETVSGNSNEAKTRAQAYNRMLERVVSIDRFDTLKAVQRKDMNSGKIYIFISKIK